MKIEFSTQLKELRKAKQMSQEQLAEALGITPQAVSKYECAQSYPDIEMLPKIADVFGVSIDYLLRGSESNNIGKIESETAKLFEDFPQDDVLRIVQIQGRKILRKDTYNADLRIPLEISEVKPKLDQQEPIISVEIWGSAVITGDISINGGIRAGNSVNVMNGSVSGGISAGDIVNCGNVSGGVAGGDSVNCGNVSGGVSAGDSVNCGNVSGGVSAGDIVYCGDVEGNVKADEVECNIIKKDCRCDGELHCKVIEGNVTCTGDIYYES